MISKNVHLSGFVTLVRMPLHKSEKMLAEIKDYTRPRHLRTNGIFPKRKLQNPGCCSNMWQPILIKRPLYVMCMVLKPSLLLVQKQTQCFVKAMAQLHCGLNKEIT